MEGGMGGMANRDGMYDAQQRQQRIADWAVRTGGIVMSLIQIDGRIRAS